MEGCLGCRLSVARLRLRRATRSWMRRVSMSASRASWLDCWAWAMPRLMPSRDWAVAREALWRDDSTLSFRVLYVGELQAGGQGLQCAVWQSCEVRQGLC